ncbi:MAG: metallopeptidase family protein [Bdellovibrionales bacterium]
MDAKHIIMNFTVPPGLNDFETLIQSCLEAMPDEILEFINNLEIVVDDFPDDAIQSDMDIDDPYELLALYRSGSEVSPGIEKKQSDSEDILSLFRRPILDVWCENCEDITTLLRDVIIEEVARAHNFSDAEIDDMTRRHHQQAS